MGIKHAIHRAKLRKDAIDNRRIGNLEQETHFNHTVAMRIRINGKNVGHRVPRTAPRQRP